MKPQRKGRETSTEGLVVLGDQLFAPEHFAVFARFPTFMAEDLELCTRYRYHKTKLGLFLGAMREFAANTELAVDYHALDADNGGDSYLDRLGGFVEKHGLTSLHIYEVEDHFFDRRLREFCAARELTLHVHPTPAFLTSRAEFEDYLSTVKRPFLKTFYERQRRRRRLLMAKDGTPEGGKFSFDAENRRSYRRDVAPPRLPVLEIGAPTRAALAVVESRFGEHPGELNDFWMPTTRDAALAWLHDFVANRLEDFGEFEDAIHSEHDLLHHSCLSPLMNCGLLTPDEVIKAAVKAYRSKKLPLNSVEGFVRQILGWREFVRGIYHRYDEVQSHANFFGHKRKLTSAWYDGTTGLPPLDDAIRKARRLGYTHHIERLMVISNTMLLAGIAPQEVHRWFMEMYVDSADWVMGPNVYGMGQFSDGGIFATKPYICGSNYWLKMSNYRKGDWCDAIDGLYWEFIDRHRDFFGANPRLSMTVRSLKAIAPERRARLKRAAADFVAANTR